MKLSVCVVTLDEEEFIDMFLRSVVSNVHQVVILDGGSCDETIKIIESWIAVGHNINLLVAPQTHPRSYDFDEKRRRQMTFDEATGDWILVTAPDEIMDDKFWLKCQRLMADERFNYYSFPRINLWKNPRFWRLDSYPDPQARMFRKGMATYSEGKEHGFLMIPWNGIHIGEGGNHARIEDCPIYHLHWCSKSRPFNPLWKPPEAVVVELPSKLPEALENNGWTKSGFPERWE